MYATESYIFFNRLRSGGDKGCSFARTLYDPRDQRFPLESFFRAQHQHSLNG